MQQMNWMLAIEHTQMLARECTLPGFLTHVWGSQAISYNGREVDPNSYAMHDLSGFFMRSTPYFVDAHVQEVVEAAAPSVPPHTRLREQVFPTRAGCLFFDHPVANMPRRVLAANSPGMPLTEPAPMSGFAWQTVPDGVVLVFLYSWAADSDTPNYMNGVYIGNIPLSVSPWIYETDTLEGFISRYQEKIHESDGLGANAERFVMSTRIAVSTLLFANQVLTATDSWPVDRAARKRAERSGWMGVPAVNVIRLRRIEHSTAPTTSHVDWSCRWFVSRHWRTLHRGTSDERVVLVNEHIKGPSTKPLRTPHPRVFAVVR